ncbi:nuclear transport factor 2 family protein [Rhodanobacter lindaniclasticus]|nr:nuclear transport factor 2 family protein [Rhodanobacter lindaniclasticus]
MKGARLMLLLALGSSLLHATEVPVRHRQLPADLAAAVAAYDRAQVSGDGQALARLLADDYVLMNSRLQVEDKAEFIRDCTAPDWKLQPFVVEQEVVRHWRHGAVLGGVATLQGMSDGAPFKVRLRFADIWRERDGRWQVVYSQASRVPPP